MSAEHADFRCRFASLWQRRFPFVFVYQIVAAPFVAALLATAFVSVKFLEPDNSTVTQNPLVIGISIGSALLSFGLMLAMSLLGFFEGWRMGWGWAGGREFRKIFATGPSAKLLRRCYAVGGSIARKAMNSRKTIQKL